MPSVMEENVLKCRQHLNSSVQDVSFSSNLTFVGHFKSVDSVKSCLAVLLPRGSSCVITHHHSVIVNMNHNTSAIIAHVVCI